MQDGFTYIELLVVLSIMAILSFIVLSAVGNAREKNYESGVQTKFANLKVQAERYYSKYNRFDDLCITSKDMDGFGGASGPGLLKDISNDNKLVSSNINVVNNVSGEWNTVTCHAFEGVWALELPQEDSSEVTPSMYCGDSTGIFVKQNNTILGKEDYSCLDLN